jgi:hypothetical protein
MFMLRCNKQRLLRAQAAFPKILLRRTLAAIEMQNALTLALDFG